MGNWYIEKLKTNTEITEEEFNVLAIALPPEELAKARLPYIEDGEAKKLILILLVELACQKNIVKNTYRLMTKRLKHTKSEKPEVVYSDLKIIVDLLKGLI